LGVSYNPLWKLLIDKGLNKSQLAAMTGIAKSTFSKMGNGGYVGTEVLEKIAVTLNCRIEDIIEFTGEQKEK